MSPTRYDVVVVGGGVVGASCAFHLKAAGHDVLILEADQPASKASGRAAGHLRTYSAGKFSSSIATYSMEFFANLASDHDQIVLYEDTDFVLAHSEDGVENLKRTQQGSTASLTFLSQDTLIESIPAFDGPSIKAALRFDDAVHTDPYLVTTALLDEALDLGTELRLERATSIDPQEDAVSIETDESRYRGDDVVIATGAWTTQLTEQLGIEIPLQPRTSQIVILEPNNPLSLPMFHAPDLGLYGRTEPNGDILIGGGSTTPIPDPDAFTTNAREPFIQHVATHSGDIATPLADASIVNDWAGRCSATPDRNPLIGETTVDGVYLCAGFNGGGVARAPFAGRLVADLVCEREPKFDPTPFRPDRFDGTEEFTIKSATTNW